MTGDGQPPTNKPRHILVTPPPLINPPPWILTPNRTLPPSVYKGRLMRGHVGAERVGGFCEFANEVGCNSDVTGMMCKTVWVSGGLKLCTVL